MVASKLNFFLIGAPKSGTTLIHARMSEHPQVFLSPLKEPNHHATDIEPAAFSKAFKANLPPDLGLYFDQRPLASRQIGFVRDPDQYASLFDEATAEHRVIGECSASYLWSQEAASNVANAHPEAKILVALRNPMERLYSHWQMARKYGFTTLPLMEAVAQDQSHSSPGWGRSELFVEAGLYADGLRRWTSRFAKGQVKVVLNEHLNDPQTWEDLARWLGVEGPLPEAGEGAGNPAGMAKWQGVNAWVTRSGLKSWASKRLPTGVKGKLVRHWYTRDGLPKMTSEERAGLLPFFESDIRETEALTGLDLSHWTAP